jgi:putative mRNA 3-end processing factor
MGHYLCANSCKGVLTERLGKKISVETLPYGESKELNGVRVSFHPAGHVLGSAQIRVEYKGEVWVVSGDYKTENDPTCQSFELVHCNTFVTESTFGLPVYQWPNPGTVVNAIHAWWKHNQESKRTSVLFAYSLGKAQRILSQLDDATGPIFVHSAVDQLLPHYTNEGIAIPRSERATRENVRSAKGSGFVIAPPAVDDSALLRSFGPVSTAFASGWMALRGTRRWRSADRGFVISDHADWTGLQTSILATGAERVLVTHGYTKPMVRWLREQGLEADGLETRFDGESTGTTEGSE